MHKYDYSFLKDLKISSKLIGLSNVIAESNYKFFLNKTKNKKTYQRLHEKAVIESTISSNRIEGIETSPKREKELLSKNDKPLNHSEQEISGYRDAIIYISNHYDELQIDTKTIRYIHSLLMYDTSKEKGEYKKTDNEISIRYENGGRETIFVPVSSIDVEYHMEELVKAYESARRDNEINNMLLIPCFIIDFLAIHPFTDGNGRVSRLLTLLLLYKEGYDIGKYISYEKKIEEYKWNYYQQLRLSQNGWNENTNDYSPFIIFHFQILYRCYKEIGERFLETGNKKSSKKTKIENAVLNAVVPVSKAEIADAFPDISITTIEKVLSDLIKQGKIKKIGTYKNARYIEDKK